MIQVESKGNFGSTEKFLRKKQRINSDIASVLNKYGKMGVDALAYATPVRTGKTAESWTYEIEAKRGSCSITWMNSSRAGGAPLVLLINSGHGTRTGGYVRGLDFINPAIRPVFDAISDGVWKEVSKL